MPRRAISHRFWVWSRWWVFEAEEEGECFSRGVDLPGLDGDRPGGNGVVEAGDDGLGAAGALEEAGGVGGSRGVVAGLVGDGVEEPPGERHV